MAQFKHEVTQRNIRIIYPKSPKSNPIANMVIVGVMEAFDELHSLMQKKGLAGMAENVRQGFRAGGHASTGTTRDGKAVTKFKLIPDDDAPLISKFLK